MDKKQEFDPTIKIIDCDSYGCDMYKFNGQAICFLNGCPYEKGEKDE